jgi:NADH-quinone oxidoreductase subunit N
MLLVQSAHFLLLFITLETATVAFYILISYGRNSTFSLEAGIKYLILGGVSSSVLMLGIVLLYGIAGNPELQGYSTDSMNFNELGSFIELNQNNLVVKIGVLMVIAGIAFKIGAVPFQIWVPDVYQGAPTPITAYLAVASKAAGFFVLINLVTGPFSHLKDLLVPFLSAIAIITILFGNISAVTQRNVKRIMGLSGIAHAGYLLIGIVATFYTSEIPIQFIIFFYLVTYLLATFAVFGVVTSLAGDEDAIQELEDYEDLAKTNPFLGFVLVVGMGSLAGIPPLAGFIAKLLLFIVAFQAKLYLLVGVAVLGVVISIYYYFGWIREATFRIFRIEDDENKYKAKDYESGLSIYHKLIFSLVAVLSIVFGIFQTAFNGIIW